MGPTCSWGCPYCDTKHTLAPSVLLHLSNSARSFSPDRDFIQEWWCIITIELTQHSLGYDTSRGKKSHSSGDCKQNVLPQHSLVQGWPLAQLYEEDFTSTALSKKTTLSGRLSGETSPLSQIVERNSGAGVMVWWLATVYTAFAEKWSVVSRPTLGSWQPPIAAGGPPGGHHRL